MISRLKCLVGLAATAAAGMMCVSPVQAQAPTFGTGVGNYALLNGDNLALYVDHYGDLGAPQNATTPTKPGGSLNGTGQPYINVDGSVNNLGGTNEYAALYNPTATFGSVQSQVQQKTEYITLGNRNAVEGWSVSVNDGASFVPYNALGMTAGSISTTYNSVTGLATATTDTTYKLGATNLGIQQEVLFNDTGRKNIAEFVTTFTNNGTSAISGLQYARGIDPNQGVASPGTTSDVNTNQSFGTSADLTQFAINSSDQLGQNRMLALGVRSTDSNAVGSIIYATSGGQTQNALLTSPELARQGNPSYIQLLPGGGASYVDAANPADDATTTNYQQYLQNPALAPFLNAADDSITPAFSSFADTDMVLLSPTMSLAPGASTSYTFYYTFGTPNPVPTPEPGVVSLLTGSALAASATMFRSRRRSR
jgi:hypothetical protein